MSRPDQQTDNHTPLRELLLARVVAGSIRCVVRDAKGRPTPLLIGSSSRGQRYVAQEIYGETLADGELEGLWSEDELLEHLYETGQWDDQRESLLAKLPKEIEQFKLGLWQSTFKSEEKKRLRQCLAIAKHKLEEVYQERHHLDFLSAAGNAAVTRSRFLLACGLRHADGSAVFPDGTFWEETSDILDQAITFYAKNRLNEPIFRDLARNEPWRSTWSCRKHDSLFGIPACDYSDEQSSLVRYSGLYDSVYEHPDCPDDEVIADDDVLDGWFINQKKQRDRHRLQKAGEELVANQRIRDSQEVFIPVDTAGDAEKIDALNDGRAAAVKRQRFSHLEKHGVVNEADMPDTRRQLVMQMNQMMAKGDSK